DQIDGKTRQSALNLPIFFRRCKVSEQLEPPRLMIYWKLVRDGEQVLVAPYSGTSTGPRRYILLNAGPGLVKVQAARGNQYGTRWSYLVEAENSIILTVDEEGFEVSILIPGESSKGVLIELA